MTGCDNRDYERFLRFAIEAADAVPDTGQFAATREMSAWMEYTACREALDWLSREKGWPHPIAAMQPDPPDVVFQFADGETRAFEFARVVHAKTIETIKHRRSKGDQQAYYQNWTPHVFQVQVDHIVRQKEAIFRTHLAHGRCTKPLVLVLGSDGIGSGPHLIEGFQISSDVFSEILLHLGYPGNPDNRGNATDPMAFPSLFDIRSQ